MASSILHIKDSYYFEVPRFIYRSNRKSKDEFPDVWIQTDPDYQEWEAHRQVHDLERLIEAYNTRQVERKRPTVEMPDGHDLVHHWQHWQHEDHLYAGRPFDMYLEQELGEFSKALSKWKSETKSVDKSVDAYLADESSEATAEHAWLLKAHLNDGEFRTAWATVKEEITVQAYKSDKTITWTGEKIASYNSRLHGKIIIPQPFGRLRNMYEPESGFCISKFMIIEVVVALILVMSFSWLARGIASGKPAKGRLANLLETFLVFIRDQIARPAIGHGADPFVPILWTLFMFVLGCNLFGLIPWLGAPTATWGVTAAFALVTFGTVLVSGMKKFGFVGFFLNQIPSMDLPLVLAVVIKPAIFVVEIGGMLIKHGVLSVRLLANMVAGHLVMLAIFAMAVGVEATMSFSGQPGMHYLVMFIVILGTTVFSMLELFVAFLQAYVFTLLSALFIGAAVHKH
ncbi:MAG: F0F1 ATP synthase subunit A [Pirellulaceae bacterium]